METVPSKRKLAFSRWHERQLFHSFAWFTTCLLGGVVIATILEFVGLNTPGFTPLITLVVLYVTGLMTIAAWRRFWALLSWTQHCASRATCARCGAYGRFDVVSGADAIPAECRQCGHRWTIEPA